MTYLYEYTILDDNIKVEYTFSTVTDGIKVVDMWVDDKPHSVNWMGPEARAKLMTRLEEDMTNRMCGTTDDDSMIEPFMRANNMFDEDEVDVITDHIETEVSEQDEYFEGGGYNGFELSEGVEFIPESSITTTTLTTDTEVDLDRDVPGFEGTWDELEDMVDNVVGEPEYLGGR